jgi:hypothetical protein
MQVVYVVLTTQDTRYGLEVVAEGAYRFESDAKQAAEQLREQGYYESVTVEYLRLRDNCE